MANYSIDTAAAIRDLKDAECSEPLAEVIVGLVMKSQDDVATKSDIRELKNDLKTLEAVMETKFDSLDQKIETNINSLKTEIEAAKNQVLVRGVMALFACMGITIAAMKFFVG